MACNPHSAEPKQLLRRPTASNSAPLALDAAFAELPDVLARVDEAQPRSPRKQEVAETERLVAKIGEQLKVLQEQRDRIARLLKDLDLPTKV